MNVCDFHRRFLAIFKGIFFPVFPGSEQNFFGSEQFYFAESPFSVFGSEQFFCRAPVAPGSEQTGSEQIFRKNQGKTYDMKLVKIIFIQVNNK